MRTHSVTFRPYWYIIPSLRAITAANILCLIPVLLILAYEKNAPALLVAGAAILASLASEIAANLLRARKFYSGLAGAALQGIITGMLFPQNYPVVSVFLITLGVFFTAKHLFGGMAGTWINAAALAAAIAFLAGAAFFPAPFDIFEFTGVHNPSRFFLQTVGDSSREAPVIDFLNNSIFRFMGTSVPGGYITLLCDSGSAVTAFRFNALVLLASLFLILFNMIHWIIPACYLGVYLCLVWLFGGMATGTGFATGDVLFALFTGGTCFTAFFLLSWFGTVPLSRNGKAVYGIFAGFAAFFIAGPGTSPSGAAFTVLAANVFSMFVQYAETKYSRAMFYKKLRPKIKAVSGGIE
jgi:electron transport complex protein RnfD